MPIAPADIALHLEVRVVFILENRVLNLIEYTEALVIFFARLEIGLPTQCYCASKISRFYTANSGPLGEEGDLAKVIIFLQVLQEGVGCLMNDCHFATDNEEYLVSLFLFLYKIFNSKVLPI